MWKTATASENTVWRILVSVPYISEWGFGNAPLRVCPFAYLYPGKLKKLVSKKTRLTFRVHFVPCFKFCWTAGRSLSSYYFLISRKFGWCKRQCFRGYYSWPYLVLRSRSFLRVKILEFGYFFGKHFLTKINVFPKAVNLFKFSFVWKTYQHALYQGYFRPYFYCTKRSIEFS